MKKEKSTVCYSANNLPPVTDKDIQLLRMASREPIDFADIPEITADDCKKAVLMPPISDPAWAQKMAELAGGKSHSKKPIISLDDEVIGWFQNHSKNCQASVNHVLRHYILSHELPN